MLRMFCEVFAPTRAILLLLAKAAAGAPKNAEPATSAPPPIALFFKKPERVARSANGSEPAASDVSFAERASLGMCALLPPSGRTPQTNAEAALPFIRPMQTAGSVPRLALRPTVATTLEPP